MVGSEGENGGLKRKPLVVLDCRTEGVERLSILDPETEQIICRIESLVSGAALTAQDEANAARIARVPHLERVAEEAAALAGLDPRHPMFNFRLDRLRATLADL